MMSEYRMATDHVRDFLDAMRENDVPFIGEIVADGVLRRIYVEGDKKGSRNGWYKLYGDERPAGAFGTKKGDLSRRWSAKAAAEIFGSQREGDQYGTLLAGAWSLCSTKIATLDEARAMIGRYEWSEYLEGSETEESTKALGALLGAKVRAKAGIDVSVYEVIAAAAGAPLESYTSDPKDALAILRRHGMKIKASNLLVANNSNELKNLLAGATYSSDLRNQLLRLPGASRHSIAEWFNHGMDRAVSVPLDGVLEDFARPAEAMPFDDSIAF
jgi:hypothetical protein